MGLTEARTTEVEIQGVEQISQLTFDLGNLQMDKLCAGLGPIWLEIWVGGLTGKIQRVGRSMEYNGFSLAQMLVAKRNDLNRKLAGGGFVEVHSQNYPGGLPRYMYVAPDRIDPLLLESQMAGALSVCGPNFGDYRARIILEKALKGEMFVKPKKPMRYDFPINGNGNGV